MNTSSGSSHLRVAQCITCPLTQHGGVEVLVRALIDGLQGEVELFLVSVDNLNSLGVWNDKLAGHFCWDSNNPSRTQIESLIRWALQNRIDVLHFHLGYTYAWNTRSWTHCPITECRRAGIRCVSTNHGAFSLWDFVGPQRSWPFRLLALILCWPAKLRQLAAVDWEATVSMHDFHAVRRWFFPLRSKFNQIYHSVLDESIIPDLPKKNIVLCLGTVGSRKGQQHLAEAFGRIARRFPDWRLVIAGRHAPDGTPEAMFEAIKLHNIADQVDVLTDVSDKQARILLAEAAVFGMPSLAEGLGLSLQEALYARAACVGSRIGGIPDLIIDGKTGLLVPPADPHALKESLVRVMEDSPLREAIAKAGRHHILERGMTKDGMTRAYLKLYQLADGSSFSPET